MYLNITKLFEGLLKDLLIDKNSSHYLMNRLKNEGIKFVTVTLPGLWKSCLISIERGYFDYKEVTSFSRKGKLPSVMHGLFSKIFDSNGKLLDNPCQHACLAIRQVCEYMYKCAFTFDEDQLESSTKSFLSTEESMRKTKGSIDEAFVDECRKSFETYYKPLVNAKLEDVLEQYRPSNGPGSVHVSDKFAKYAAPELKMASGSITGTFRDDQKPFAGFFKAYPSSRESLKAVKEWKLSQVLFVPKDSRGPRVISKEPMFLLKMQMCFLKWSTEALEKVTKNRINFKDQTKNRELAQQASVDRKNATMDLKEASDRIRYSVARTIYGNSPVFYYFLTKARSTHSVIKTAKSVRTVQLTKLSGMGSGLTFPILALTIHIAVCTRIAKRHGIPYEEAMSLVYVYGDDLIVPTKYVDCVYYALEAVGLALNASKSFVKGPFRESCGGDYLNGKEVSPLRLKLSSCKLPTTKSVDQHQLVVRSCKREIAVWKLTKVSRTLIKPTIDIVGTKKVLTFKEVRVMHNSLRSCVVEEKFKRVVRTNVRPFRVNLSMASGIVSLERHARLCVQRGYNATAKVIYTYLEKVLGPLPYVGGSVAFIGKYSQSTFQITSQVPPKVVYTTQAVQRSIQIEPCPYRYLGQHLRRESVNCVNSTSVNRKYLTAINAHDGEKALELLDITPPGLELGQYNERYAINVIPRTKVQAWQLTNVL